MRALILAAAFALAPGAPSLAQEAAGQASQEDLRAAAESYARSAGVQRMMDAMLSPDALAEALRAQFGDQVTEAQRSRIVEVVGEELGAIRPAMEAAMIEAAAETYTLEEIEAMTAFYETPEGVSVLAKMQPYMTAFYEAVAPEFQAAQTRAMQRLQETAPAE